MYLKKLNVDHFGKFHNKEIELDRSVNVIYGSNEAGKTTIHKFIEGILFGFFKQNTKKKLYTPEYSKYRPWTGSQYVPPAGPVPVSPVFLTISARVAIKALSAFTVGART